MKEAQGELNMTIVVVTIVAGLSLFFFSFIWPNIRGNFVRNSNCSEAICTCPSRDSQGNCVVPSDGLVDCQIRGSNQTIKCPWRG